MAYAKCINLNEAGDPNGEVHLNPDQVVAVVGSTTEPSVRVLTTSGVVYHVQQLPNDEAGPVLTRVGG